MYAVFHPSTSLRLQPIRISSYPLPSANAQDSGLPNTKGAGPLVFTQAERAEGYRNYTTSLAKSPYVVGFHWFQWADQPKEGRADGENSNYGVVTANGSEHADPCLMC
jgi:agarase